MNKHLSLFLGATFSIGAFLVWIKVCSAQNTTDAVVGNPGSDNQIFITQTYGLINNNPSMQNEDMEPLPGSPGVEVAPPPNRIPEYQNNDFTPTEVPLININETINEE